MAAQPPDYNPITTTPTTFTTAHSPAAATTATALPAPATTTAVPLPTHPDNNPGPPVVAQKRQRRPSVRLGEIGDQPAATLSLHDSHAPHRNIRTTKNPSSWQNQNQNFSAIKSGWNNNNNNRSLTTDLVNGSDSCGDDDDDDNNDQNYPHQSRKALKSKRVSATTATTTKRVRSNWVTSEEAKSEVKGFRNFDRDSDQSPILSGDVAVDLMRNRQSDGIRVSDNDNYYEVENDSKCEGVRSWLIELGLSRYTPVFEIHEVDDEVLPMLTLEDLRDMGINAVGSRRKLYAAIQKLRHKGFS